MHALTCQSAVVAVSTVSRRQGPETDQEDWGGGGEKVKKKKEEQNIEKERVSSVFFCSLIFF